MSIKQSIQSLLAKNATTIICALPSTFDSHDFIQALIKEDEEGYVRELNGCIDSKGGIFRNFHSQIGKYLSENAQNLGINSIAKEPSGNIKGYESQNEKWSKVN